MHEQGRLEAFSDGVIAIIITIMVLELKVPHGDDLAALRPLLPVFLSYVLSFVYVGIYWNNHHHLLHATQHDHRRRSCGPTCTCCSGCRWFRSSPAGWARTRSPQPGGALWRRAADGRVAYALLVRALLKHHEADSPLARASAATPRATSRVLLYVIGIVSSWIHPAVSLVFYVVVTVIWLVPDRRIEKALKQS